MANQTLAKPKTSYLSHHPGNHYHVAFGQPILFAHATRLSPLYGKAVIVGVGLLGGSIALALKQRKLASRIVGVGRPTRPPTEAVSAGLIDEAFGTVAQACEGADLVICCAPVQQIAAHVLEAAQVVAPKCLITDVGSTKRTIVEQIQSSYTQIPFVGSHPLAGGTSTGFQHAQAELLQDSLVIVTPSATTPTSLQAETESLWQRLGARTLVMTPQQHDLALAQTSHLPHIVASALAAATPPELLPLAATGWRSSTRIAAGNAQLWRQILEENRLPALEALQKFEAVLKQWLVALESADGPTIERLLEQGKATRDALGS